MKTVELIIECTMDEERERRISELGKVKYKLPMINSYVLEVPENALKQIQGMDQIKAVHETSHIIAQMNTARKTVNADKAQHEGLTGRGVTIAIIDTGISDLDDFVLPRNRIIAFKDIIGGKSTPYDDNAHGTHESSLKSLHFPFETYHIHMFPFLHALNCTEN